VSFACRRDASSYRDDLHMNAITLHTPRLVLRPWRDEDVDSFAAMFDDPAVMEFLPAQKDRAAIEALLGRMRAHLDARGFGWWAAELKSSGAFIGFVGLSRVPFEAHFTPAVEVGWRLASAHWGKGYATEGARAALHAGFTRLGLGEIVSFTVPPNARSWGVMTRIGMTHDPADDFDHPRLPEGDPLRRHVLYRISRARWEETREPR
jgi:RimJ/RimL family protein N-acetyltransferase